MKYKRFGEDIVARLEVGEEVIASLSDIAEREGVTFAEVSGIGAADEFDVSVYDVKAKVYFDNTFREPLEITSLSGTVTEMNGAPHPRRSVQEGRDRRRRTSQTRRHQRDVRTGPAHRLRPCAEVLRRAHGTESYGIMRRGRVPGTETGGCNEKIRRRRYRCG